MKTLAVSILFLASVVLADNFKTISGKEYENARVSRVEPDGIVLITKSGISKLYFAELPKEVQERFHYDAERASAYSAEQNAAVQMVQKQQAEVMRQKAEATQTNNGQLAKEQALGETEFLAMQGIAKRVQDFLTSTAPITKSTVMVPGKPASDGGYQIMIISSKPFVVPASDNIPASKDPRKAWMIFATVLPLHTQWIVRCRSKQLPLATQTP